MAFVNQVSATNFVPQKLKVLKVLCQECFQEIETQQFVLTVNVADVTVTPADIPNLVFDVVPGTPIVANITVLPNKVLNTISVPLSITATLNGLPILLPSPTVIPSFIVPGEIECPGVVPDGTVNVQKHDLQVLEPIVPVVVSFTIDPATGIVDSLTVSITVIVEGCAIISKEEILKINAASLFCPCP